MERWKDVKDYDGIYQVSNRGRVRSILKDNIFGIKCRPRVLSIFNHNLGYKRVRFFNTTRYVHTLVAEVFLKKPDYRCEVNHKDLDKSFNWDTNLEYITHKENIQKAQDVETWGKHKKTKRLDIDG